MPKPRKLAHGEGSVYEMRPGLWRAQAVIAGRRRSASGRTKTEAVKALDKLRADVEGTADNADADKDDGASVTVPRLSAWLATWAAELAPEASANTDANRAWAIGHLAPLGAVPLDKLTAKDVRALLERKADTLGRSSLDRVRSVLFGALNGAIAEGYITHNVAAGRIAPLPRTARRVATQRALTEAEAANMLTAAAEDRDGLVVVLGYYLGMRPGEVTGLRWSDVDLDAGTLTIAQMRRRDADGSLTMCGPKADSGRTLALPEPVTAALRAHRAASGRIGGLVVATRNGTPLDPSNHRRIVRRIAEAAGIFWRPTPNELRHTHATHRLNGGAAKRAVAHGMGHASTRMLDRHYDHGPAEDGGGRDVSTGLAVAAVS
jgi:integrase